MPAPEMPLTLLAVGSNGKGQLGTGDVEDRHVFVPVTSWPDSEAEVVSLAAGANHTLLLVKKGRGESTALLIAGDNSRGQCDGSPLPEETTSFRPVNVALLLQTTGLVGALEPKHVAASWDSSFVVLEPDPSQEDASDVVISFGGSDFGERGRFDPPLDRASTVEYLTALPDGAKAARVAALEAGPRHVLASIRYRLQDHAESAVVGWGAARHGQMGPDARVQLRAEPMISATPDHAFGLSRVCHCPIRLPQSQADVIAVGKDHSALLSTAEGKLQLLGSNKRGQLCGGKREAILSSVDLNVGQEAAKILQTACCWNSTFALCSSSRHVSSNSSSSDLFSWGSNSHGQLGRAQSPTSSPAGDYNPVPTLVQLPPLPIVDIAAGSEHVLALLETSSGARELWGWGWNEHGNLGIGEPDETSRDVNVPRRIEIPCEGQIVGVKAGCATSFVVVSSP